MGKQLFQCPSSWPRASSSDFKTSDGDGGPNHWEMWLRDPNGYTVVLASPDGTAG